MSLPAGWIALAAFLALLLGLWLMLVGRGMRRRRGLGVGKTVSLDRVTLTSRRLGLTGRPDRLIKADGSIIVEEWKSARTLRPWHRAQMGVYFLLVEEELRIRPSHGFVVLGDGTRHRIENTAELLAWVLDLAGQIRAARAVVTQPIPVNPVPGQCRPCGMRGHCGQARLQWRPC
jgi:CRISPR-associated exonuclease Cas4